MNIVDSCFQGAPDSPAIIHQAERGDMEVMTLCELETLTNRVAFSLVQNGFEVGDALAIMMPMTPEAVAIYLGIIKAGCIVVGIPESFQPKEIATRLRLSEAAGVFTNNVMRRSGREYPLYANVVEAGAPRTIVLPSDAECPVSLRTGDCTWADFLAEGSVESVSRSPDDPVNILFSSGTTAEPKAIPWTQTTPIKCAADAHFHQNINPGDVLVWPTSMGWMMGPWLTFAALLNRATIGLYCGAPTGREFGLFIQDSKATMLGVVPSLVSVWKNSGCVQGLDWRAIKVFSSTGECSRPQDMRWLMALAGGCPVIEYCGGTEIGGGYITGSVTRPCVAGTFNTPALGLDVVILNEDGASANEGEIYLVPPSIGLSSRLLHGSHYKAYFEGVPRGPHGELLRRHGDQMERLTGGFWRSHGRADDAMNLGGIKISSAEIERVLQTVPNVAEAAAVAVSPDGGPSRLVVYVVCSERKKSDKDVLAAAMQNAIRADLNPLFRIHDVVIADALPRTASNKVMRRLLRDQYTGVTRI